MADQLENDDKENTILFNIHAFDIENNNICFITQESYICNLFINSFISQKRMILKFIYKIFFFELHLIALFNHF